jgi:hypothetical protein
MYNPSQFDSIVVKNLEQKYGQIKRNDQHFGGTFNSDSVFVEYGQYTEMEQEINSPHNRFTIIVTYLPLYDKIKQAAKNEQESIF